MIGQLVLQTLNLSWNWCFLIASMFLLTMGVLMILFLEPYPEKLGYVVHEEEKKKLTAPDQEDGKSVYSDRQSALQKSE